MDVFDLIASRFYAKTFRRILQMSLEFSWLGFQIRYSISYLWYTAVQYMLHGRTYLFEFIFRMHSKPILYIRYWWFRWLQKGQQTINCWTFLLARILSPKLYIQIQFPRPYILAESKAMSVRRAWYFVFFCCHQT